MTRDELKEKVARGQYERQFKGLDQDVPDPHDDFTQWDDLPVMEREFYLDDATAAIALVLSEAAKVGSATAKAYGGLECAEMTAAAILALGGKK